MAAKYGRAIRRWRSSPRHAPCRTRRQAGSVSEELSQRPGPCRRVAREQLVIEAFVGVGRHARRRLRRRRTAEPAGATLRRPADRRRSRDPARRPAAQPAGRDRLHRGDRDDRAAPTADRPGPVRGVLHQRYAGQRRRPGRRERPMAHLRRGHGGPRNVPLDARAAPAATRGDRRCTDTCSTGSRGRYPRPTSCWRRRWPMWRRSASCRNGRSDAVWCSASNSRLRSIPASSSSRPRVCSPSTETSRSTRTVNEVDQ